MKKLELSPQNFRYGVLHLLYSGSQSYFQARKNWLFHPPKKYFARRTRTLQPHVEQIPTELSLSFKISLSDLFSETQNSGGAKAPLAPPLTTALI